MLKKRETDLVFDVNAEENEIRTVGAEINDAR